MVRGLVQEQDVRGVTMNLASARRASPSERNFTGLLWKSLNFMRPRSAFRSLRPSSGAASTSVWSTPLPVSRPQPGSGRRSSPAQVLAAERGDSREGLLATLNRRISVDFHPLAFNSHALAPVDLEVGVLEEASRRIR